MRFKTKSGGHARPLSVRTAGIRIWSRLTAGLPIMRRACLSLVSSDSKSPFAKYKFDDKEYYGPFSKQLLTSYFNNGADTPKVQMPYKTVPGKSPRDLTKER